MEQAIKRAIEGGYKNDWKSYGTGISAICILSKGKSYEITVDSSDLNDLSKFRWHLTSNGYAITWIGKKRVRMHHLLLGKPARGTEIDHINRNRLDNRRSNLRLVSRQENAHNTAPVGVRKRGNSWEANLCFNYRKHFKGGFKTREEALNWRSDLLKDYQKTVWI